MQRRRAPGLQRPVGLRPAANHRCAPSDLEYMIAYQIGALQAMCRLRGAQGDAPQAARRAEQHGGRGRGVTRWPSAARSRRSTATSSMSRSTGSQMETAARKLGLPLALRRLRRPPYDDNGNLASRSIPGTVLKDPKAAAEQVLRMVREGEIVALSGKRIKVKVERCACTATRRPASTSPRGIRKRLEEAGIQVVPLTEMKLVALRRRAMQPANQPSPSSAAPATLGTGLALRLAAAGYAGRSSARARRRRRRRPRARSHRRPARPRRAASPTPRPPRPPKSSSSPCRWRRHDAILAEIRARSRASS